MAFSFVYFSSPVKFPTMNSSSPGYVWRSSANGPFTSVPTVALDGLLKRLPRCPARDRLQDQLGRSGSSVGANYAESGAAESANDFIHKLSIALKEAEETDFWLGCLCLEHPEIPDAESLRRENHEFVKILQRSITTARKRK